MTLYRYGRAAWFWRALLGLFLVGGFGCLGFGVRLGELWLFVVAVVLLAPALFFGIVLAVEVHDTGGGEFWIQNLLFWWRRVRRAEIGRSRLREMYHNEAGPIYAPRVWVSVRARLPIYFDLLAQIPDRHAFAASFNVRLADVASAAARTRVHHREANADQRRKPRR